jgi:hypothetical protein
MDEVYDRKFLVKGFRLEGLRGLDRSSVWLWWSDCGFIGLVEVYDLRYFKVV